MRGMDSAESAQELMEGMRIYYNFCREHSTLGKTPAEMVGIKIRGKNKWLTLIQNGSKEKTLIAIKYINNLVRYYTKMHFSIITNAFVILPYTKLVHYYIKE